MSQNAQTNLVAQVQTLTILLQNVHHPQRLLIVPEGLAQNLAEGVLPGVTEGGVAQIMAQGNGL